MRQSNTRWMVVTAGLLLMAGATSAAAQEIPAWTDRGFVNVNVGAQTADRRYEVTGSFPSNLETASYAASFTSGKGTIFDLFGGVRVFRNFAVALGFTRYSDSYDSTIEGFVPDWLVFDNPHPQSLPLSGLDQTETGIHLSAAFVLPIYERLNVALFGGPSFIALDKDVLGSVSVVPGQTVFSSPTTAKVSGTGVGGHIGVDLSYEIVRTAGVGVGVGLFLRQAGAAIDTDAVDGGEVKVGGFNYGVGARLRF